MLELKMGGGLPKGSTKHVTDNVATAAMILLLFGAEQVELVSCRVGGCGHVDDPQKAFRNPNYLSIAFHYSHCQLNPTYAPMKDCLWHTLPAPVSASYSTSCSSFRTSLHHARRCLRLSPHRAAEYVGTTLRPLVE